MNTDRELMQQALEGLEKWRWGDDPRSADDYITALRERLAQPEQEFTEHEEGEDGWSDWVCPDPKSYLMKCCDCGLVHEAQFGVVRYKSETEREDCDMVDDPNLQAVFRMRRSEQWSPDDTAHRAGGFPMEQPAQQQDGPINEGWQITVAHGHSGYGVYAHMEDYPEEGAVLVQAIEQPAQHRHISYVCPQCYWSLEEQPAPAPKVREQQEPVGHGGRPMTLRECMEAEEPASKPWVGLTDEERNAIERKHGLRYFDEVFHDIEAKLREKNA